MGIVQSYTSGSPRTRTEPSVVSILCMVGSIVEAKKLEHHYPHALKVKYKGS